MEKNMKHYNIEQDMRYLQLLSQSFPTIAEASTEIINLQAISPCQRVPSISLPTSMVSMRPSCMY